MPSWLPESALSAFPAAATLRVVPLHGDPGRNVYPLLHARSPPASSTFSLPPPAAPLSSCAGATLVDLDLPLHSLPRSSKGTIGPPHPTHSKPNDSPATNHEGSAVTANLDREGTFCKSWP